MRKPWLYGGVDYATGTDHLHDRSDQVGNPFPGVFLKALLRAYPGRKIRLVCDNGRFHHTNAVRQWLKEHRKQIRVYWLPPYSPSLNLIERPWGHLKRTVLANVLFETLDDLIAAFRLGDRANQRPSRPDGIHVQPHIHLGKKTA